MREEVDLFPAFPVETDSFEACALFSHTGGSAQDETEVCEHLGLRKWGGRG